MGVYGRFYGLSNVLAIWVYMGVYMIEVQNARFSQHPDFVRGSLPNRRDRRVQGSMARTRNARTGTTDFAEIIDFYSIIDFLSDLKTHSSSPISGAKILRGSVIRVRGEVNAG